VNSKKILVGTGAIIVALLLALLILWLEPPDLIRVGANYTAKIVCSNVFLAHRDAGEVLMTDVQAPGHPLLKLMRVSVDPTRGVVRAGLFGFIGSGLAVSRPNSGCTVVPDQQWQASRQTKPESRAPATAEAATAEAVAAEVDDSEVDDATSAVAPADIARIVADDALAGPGMRAIVVLHHGRVIAERYAAGFDRQTPQLGWSMTKSVTAGLIGILVKEGRLTLAQSADLSGGGREHITIADLLSMSSGLAFNEGYGAVSDVTRMLYLESDMAAFAAAKPLEHPPGTVWSYSSGSAVVLSRRLQQAAAADVDGGDIIAWSNARLFGPLHMQSAILETDEHGTLVGSSYMYATPRDWARFGQLLLQDGIWQGQEILPRGYVAMMTAPVAASGGEYGQGLVWRWATHSDKPGENPDAAFGIPQDAFWMSGHDGQYVAIVPSRQLVVARLGLTPARERYQPEPLVQALLEATSRL
jgi:CubicO group peptidase (beta-lactamase class C family)